MAATLVGVVAAHAFGALGVVVATAFEVVVIFVLAELAPKTWAVQHTERAALRAAPLIRLLVAFKPLGWITRALIAITNAILPGKGMQVRSLHLRRDVAGHGRRGGRRGRDRARGTHPHPLASSTSATPSYAT